MPMASSCTSSIRARRDRAAMTAAYSVGSGGQADGADRRRCRVRHDGGGRRTCSGHAGPGRPDRGRGPGQRGPGVGVTGRPGGAAGRRHRHPGADRRALPRLRRRLPGGGRRLQPAVRAGHPGHPGADAGRRRPHARGLLGDRRRVRGVQAPGGPAPDARGPGPGRPAPPRRGVPHVAARLRAEHRRAARGRIRRPAAGSARRGVRPRPRGTAGRRDLRGPDVRVVRAQPAARPGPDGRGAGRPGGRDGGQRLAAFGLTAACEADMRRDSFGAFAEADANGLLSQRIYGLVVHDQVDWLTGAGLQGRRSGRLSAEAVKIWADGGMSSRTAAIHGSYPVPPYGSGILYFELDQLTEMVRDFDTRGFQVAIHAQGDRAIETVLDAYAALGSPGNPRRHRIEHGGAMYGPLAARAAALGIVVVSQPGFMSTLGDGFAAAFGDRSDELYAFGSWRRAGITVAGSSDAPVITADPLLGLRDAVLRRTGDGLVLGPAERLPVADALDLYTTQAAFAMHREGEIGSLEPGKLADFVVLDRNPLRTDPERITDIRVLATVLDGAPVYQSQTIFTG